MESDRPKADEVLEACDTHGTHDLSNDGPPWDWPDAFVAALREAVNAEPDDVVCLLPDGTLSVAERGHSWPSEFSDEPNQSKWHTVPLFRIPGAKP